MVVWLGFSAIQLVSKQNTVALSALKSHVHMSHTSLINQYLWRYIGTHTRTHTCTHSYIVCIY